MNGQKFAMTARTRMWGVTNWVASNLGSLMAIGIILHITVELGLGLWNWHQSKVGGEGFAAIHFAIFLILFWGVIVFMADRLCRATAWIDSKDRLLGNLGRVLLGLLGCVIWSILVLGHATHYKVGVFLNLSLLQFAIGNMAQSLQLSYATKTEQHLFMAVFIFLVTSLVGLFLLIFRTSTRVNLLGHPRFRRISLFFLLLLSIAFAFSSLALNNDADKTRRARILGQISSNLDPMVTFGLSCLDVLGQSLTERRLMSEASLVPLATRNSLSPTTMSPKPNIVCIQVESLRSDIIGKTCRGIEITPNLNRLARNGVWFTHAYAASTHTSLSQPSVYSSLYPLRREIFPKYSTGDPWPKQLIWDVLQPQGYATAWVSSVSENWCGMDQFLVTPGLDEMLDADSDKFQNAWKNPALLRGENFYFTTNDLDCIAAGVAVSWMDLRAKAHKPFFVGISFNSSHVPYQSGVEGTNWFNPAVDPLGGTNFYQPQYVRDGVSFISYSKESVEDIRELYYNSLHGIDKLIGQIVDFLHQQDLDQQTILVIYGDHGEAFYEHGETSHGKLPFDVTVRPALIINGPAYFPAKVENYPTSLIDVTPTVLARIGAPLSPNFQGIDVLSTNRPPIDRRCLYFHVDGLMKADGLLATGKWKYFENTDTADRYLFDLEHDPAEATNLVETQSGIADFLQQQLGDWQASQLAYYHSAKYYRHFYPPTPPLLPQK